MSYFVNLKNANSEIARLSGEHAAVISERDTLKTALAERDAAAESVRAQFDASLTDLTEKLSVASAQIEQLQADAKSAGQKAAEVIAAQGLDPARLPNTGSGQKLSADDLGKQIRAEADPQKRAALFAQLQTVWNSKN